MVPFVKTKLTLFVRAVLLAGFSLLLCGSFLLADPGQVQAAPGSPIRAGCNVLGPQALNNGNEVWAVYYDWNFVDYGAPLPPSGYGTLQISGSAGVSHDVGSVAGGPGYTTVEIARDSPLSFNYDLTSAITGESVSGGCQIQNNRTTYSSEPVGISMTCRENIVYGPTGEIWGGTVDVSIQLTKAYGMSLDGTHSISWNPQPSQYLTNVTTYAFTELVLAVIIRNNGGQIPYSVYTATTDQFLTGYNNGTPVYSTNTAMCQVGGHGGPLAPSASIGATPTTVTYGGTTNISWSSQETTSCTATSGAGFSTGGATSGSDGSDALTADETFTVTCTGPGGTASDSVSVAVTLPPLSCSISDNVIEYGGSVDASATGGVGSYSWSTPGATVSGSGSNIGLQYLTSGTYSVNVSTPTSGQSASCGDVFVSPAGPYAYLEVVGANPVNYNSPATLRWEGGRGDINTCVATQGPGFSTGGALSGTDQSSVLTTTTQFTVVCTGPTTSASDSRTVYVNGAAPTCTGGYPESAFTTLTAGTFYVYAQGVTSATQVKFGVWGGAAVVQDQDDLVWYQGVNLGNGRWRAAVNMGQHKPGNPEYGNFNVHIYMNNATTPDTWCGTANFTRTASSDPTVTLAVTPPSGTYPQVATLTWTTTNNPTSCVASSSTNDWTGVKGTNVSNSEALVPTVGGHTYTIVCSNAYGTDSDTVSYIQNPCVGCTPSGSISMTPASPCSITPPATSCSPTPQVSWSTTNVTYAQLMVSKKDPNTGVFGPYTLFNSGCSPNNPSGLPRSITSAGSTVDEYMFKLYSAPDCFTFPGGGLTGTVVLLWDDAYGAVPSGWTCISCAVSDPFYGRMPRLTDTYGGVGGADTHTHTLTYASQTEGASRDVGETTAGGFRPRNTHQHTWNPVTTNAEWNLPPYKHLKFISRTNPPSIPANAIALFDSAVPAGWVRYSAMDGLYVRGGPDSNPWGAATHANTFTATSATASGTVQDTANNTNVADGHNHTISGASLSAAANNPPYIDLIFGRISADGVAPAGMMAFFTAAPPAGWTTVSGPGSEYYQRLVRGSATFGGTGGTATHDHGGSVTATTGTPNSNTNVKSGFSGVGSHATHTHAVTFNVSTESSMPGYRDVILAKYSAFTLLDTKTLTGALPAPFVDLGLSNKDVVSVNGEALTNNPMDGIAEADIGNRTIPEGAPVGFAINIVNSGTAGLDALRIVVEDVVTNLAPPPGGWNTSNVTLSCNGVSCDDQYVESVSYDAGTKRITFTIYQNGGEVGLNKYLAIRYTAYPQGPLGTTASVFRFSNVASILYTDSGTGEDVSVDCTGLVLSCPLRTPMILFYRGLPVPFLKEIQ